VFTATDILARVNERPFTAFRLMTSAGESFDVHHPDLAIVRRRDVVLGISSNDRPKRYANTSRVSIMHVTSLQDLSAPTRTGGNGDDSLRLR
jgi:hypothetical protein